MLIGNFKIHIVCANEIEPNLYGDIYDEVADCRNQHPTENIMYGFYAERIFAETPDAEETPDWFYNLYEAIDWCKTHR